MRNASSTLRFPLGGKHLHRFDPRRLIPLSVRRTFNRMFGHPNIGRYFEGDADWTPPPGAFGELYAAHDGRMVMKWVHYLPIYDQLFERYRSGMPGSEPARPIRMLEIGVLSGGSLDLWRRYFGPEATIFGIDINPTCAAYDTPENPVRIGSQADPDFLARVVAEMGGVDIVLDDGSHIAKHQRASLDTLLPLLSEGGTYVVEDTQCSYWASYGGGLRRPGQIIEVAKSMVDGLTKWAYRGPIGRRGRFASEQIESITFFDSVVAFRKGTHGERTVHLVGGSDEERRRWSRADWLGTD